MATGGLPVLSRLERRIVVGVVVAGVLVLAGTVLAVVKRAELKVWFVGDEVAAAHRTAVEVDLPAVLADDPTRSACQPLGALRCAWAQVPPRDAAEAFAQTLRDAGLDVAPVVCDETLPKILNQHVPRCGAEIAVAGERMWLLATDRTPFGQVPLGRTAAWLSWDELAMSVPMTRRLQREWVWDSRTELLTRTEVEALLPERLRPILDATCRREGPNGCLDWEGPIDVSDLGVDAVPALVAELTEAGFFVDVAHPDWSSIGAQGHRFAAPNSGLGITVTIRIADGIVVGQAFTY